MFTPYQWSVMAGLGLSVLLIIAVLLMLAVYELRSIQCTLTGIYGQQHLDRLDQSHGTSRPGEKR